jgi:hypothetical protein
MVFRHIDQDVTTTIRNTAVFLQSRRWRGGLVLLAVWHSRVLVAACDDGCVHGGGAILLRGGIDDMPNKVNAFVLVLKMRWQKMAAATSGACAIVCVEGLLDWFVLLACC